MLLPFPLYIGKQLYKTTKVERGGGWLRGGSSMGPHIILLPLPLTALLWLQVGRRHGPGSDAT